MNCVRAAEKVSDCTEDGGPSNLTISSNSPEARSSARKESRRRGVSCRCSDRERERERLLVGTGVALGADQNTRAGPSTTTLTRAAFAEAVVSAGSSWDREHPHVPIVHNYTT
ncbi:hypothetical protein MPTK1_4g20680 [Marchantia polymorpha subsp. ruderalis]|uniref:Uncharacterized protein n=2 Tax=Marchantia polymorpha TaxID=3197 RepID=A0AAF6BC20_MARPO|nr:hypothetical protein MARPO_0101s0014 [Marchantia polymorpha]BBN09554.1 hypothetical protein Mp_4g20680 [Marchantia polymorpha subsp. ruderalis]|eukprot:PTQ32211.1 hypothetical protein MARPO_0101s0014 [Marchantia polymorpha]